MKITRFLALLLALLMVGAIAVAESGDDPAVVSVDGDVVTLSVIQSAFDTAYAENAALYAQNGAIMTQDDIEGALAELIDAYVQNLVIEHKIAELGFDQISEEDKNELRTLIAENYEADIAGYAAFYGVTVEEARGIYQANGLTEEGIYEMNLPSLPYLRLQEHAAAGITVTDEEAAKAYEDEYVPKDKELYGSDVASYESTTFFYGRNSVFYIPDGYRFIKHIKLQLPEDVAAQINDLNADISIARNAINSLNSELYLLENTPEDNEAEDAPARRSESDIQADLAVQEEQLTALQSLLDEAYEQVLPSLQPTIDEIYAKLEAGDSFDALIDAYSIDQRAADDGQGELIHKESSLIDAPRRDVAMALGSVDSVSEPVVCDDGVYILQHAGDAGGPVALTPEILSIIRDSLLSDRRDAAFSEAYETWASEAAIETHPELVTLPQIDATAITPNTDGTADGGEAPEENPDGSVG